MNDAKQPHTTFRFLKWFCPEHLHEEIEGDLIQKFNREAFLIGAADYRDGGITRTVSVGNMGTR